MNSPPLRRGDSLLIDFASAQAGEANHTRPAVVVTNNIANEHSPAIVMVPLTGNTERVYPFELLLPVERTGLDHDSEAQPQFVRHVSKARIRRSLSHLPDDLMLELDSRLRGYLGL